MRTLVLGLFILCSSFVRIDERNFKPKFSTIISPSKGKELLEQCSRIVPQDISGFKMLTRGEVLILEKNFERLTRAPGFDYLNSNREILPLENYAFQYLGVLINGKKYIYINAFSLKARTKNWKSEPVNVCHGGNFFWGALFSLNDFTFSQFSVNINE